MASITTAMSGKEGTVAATAGTGDVGTEVTEWSATLTEEELDATNTAGGGFYDGVSGIKKCTGSATFIGSTEPSEGTVVDLILATGTTTGDYEITGDAALTDISVTTPVQGSVVTLTASFTFRGAEVVGAVS